MGGWFDKARGKVPVNWGFQPRMVDVAPAMAEYYYKTMTENDYFNGEVVRPDGTIRM